MMHAHAFRGNGKLTPEQDEIRKLKCFSYRIEVSFPINLADINNWLSSTNKDALRFCHKEELQQSKLRMRFPSDIIMQLKNKIVPTVSFLQSYPFDRTELNHRPKFNTC